MSKEGLAWFEAQLAAKTERERAKNAKRLAERTAAKARKAQREASAETREQAWRRRDRELARIKRQEQQRQARAEQEAIQRELARFDLQMSEIRARKARLRWLQRQPDWQDAYSHNPLAIDPKRCDCGRRTAALPGADDQVFSRYAWRFRKL